MAIALTLGLALSVQAKNTVQVTLTSPTITKTGCEKVGSVTFAFDQGSEIVVGDWWYMDLPENVSICRGTINYLIVGANTGAVTFNTADATNAVFPNVAPSASIIPANAGIGGGNGFLLHGNANFPNSDGLLFSSKLDSQAAEVCAIRTGGNMAIRVYGQQGSRRITLTVVGDAPSGMVTVQSGYLMMIKILDGNAWNSQGNVTTADNAGLNTHGLILDTNSNNRYYEVGGDIISAATAEPAAENILCTNAEQMAGSYMYVSFASLNDKFTFTGDSQIAHTGSANPISLANCKGVITGNVPLGGQTGCAFEYDRAADYCANDTFRTQATEYNATGGNKLIVAGGQVFGEQGDTFEVYLYSDTPGVYFTADPGYLRGYTSAQNACTSAPGLGGSAIAAAWSEYNEAGAKDPGYPTAGACAVPTTNRVRQIRTNQFTNIHDYNKMELDVPQFTYDTSVVGNGTNVIIRVDFRKYPCGVIFSGSRTVATLVTTCPAGAGAGSNLLFPWLPAPSPTDSALSVWWGGMVIVNASDSAGTAALTVYEMDGDSGTYTTPSIAAHGMWQTVASTLVPMLTAATGNTGTLGDSNFSVMAVCGFQKAAGFAFTGNTNEGTGYPAYTDGSGWMD